MVAKGTSIINSCCENNTERMAAYRLINNKKLTMEEMVEYLAKGCSKGCSDLSHVLCIQDTTEVVFRHSGRLSVRDRDFGYGTSELDQYCIFAHPCMVVDADSRMPVGFSHIKVWSRDRAQGRKKATQRSLLKLEQKESFRWAEAASESAAALPKKVRKTMVGDRESDIYSVMCKDLAAGCDFLIRSIPCILHLRPVPARSQGQELSHGENDAPLRQSHHTQGTQVSGRRAGGTDLLLCLCNGRPFECPCQ